MPQEPDLSKPKPKDTTEPELPASWKQIQSAIWLVGLAILAWQNWWWPGILVLVAFSGLVQAGFQMALSKQTQTQQEVSQAKDLAKERGEWLPAICPSCGGPLSVSTVNWTGPTTADCPYCKTNLKKPA